MTARIIELETEPRGEIDAVYDLPAGPVAYRYAKHVRADCVAFRRIVVQYVAAVAESKAERDTEAGWVADGVTQALYGAVLAVANRWAGHREFQPEWRIQ